MTKTKRMLSVLVLSVASGFAGMFGYREYQYAAFAKEQAQVDVTRDQLNKAEDLSTVFRSVGKVVEPSVVNITVHKTVKGVRKLPLDPDLLRRFFPPGEDGQPQLPDNLDEGDLEQVGTGSGVIMDAAGGTAYVLTNNHVAGGAEEMTITLSDGRKITKATVVGTDPKSDLAVVKIEADRVIPARWGDSDDLQKGDWIMAFGSPFGYVGSMTHGIVSALHRQAGIINQGYENFIQVDAPINPGNSGGPLVNLKGEVVGINTAIASRSGAFSGIGFAIPSDQARTIYTTLKEKGKISRGWLGVSIDDVSNEPDIARSFGYEGTTGVIVRQTLPKTPAYDKLKQGDIISALNGKAITDVQQLRNTIAMTAPGTEVTMKVFRGGKNQEVSLKVGDQPEDTLAAAGGAGNSPAARGTGKSDETAVDTLGIKLATPTDQLAEKFGMTDVKAGAIITAVTPKSVAYKAGLRMGDVITSVGNQEVKTAKEASDALAKADLKNGVRLYVETRGGGGFIFLKAP